MGSEGKTEFRTAAVDYDPAKSHFAVQTVCEVPLNLYMHKPDHRFLQKVLKLKLVGLRRGEEVYLGKRNIDLTEFLNANKSELSSLP